jgi:hypothetical protein
MAYSPEHDAVILLDEKDGQDNRAHLVHWDAHLTEGRLEKPRELQHLQIEPVPTTQVVELGDEAKVEAGADYVVRVWGVVTGQDKEEAVEVTQPLRVGCVSIFLRGLNQAQVEQVAAQLGVPLETNLVDTGLSPAELVQRINRGLVPDELPDELVREIFQTFARLFGAGLSEGRERVLGPESGKGSQRGTIRPGDRGRGTLLHFSRGLAEAA